MGDKGRRATTKVRNIILHSEISSYYTCTTSKVCQYGSSLLPRPPTSSLPPRPRSRPRPPIPPPTSRHRPRHPNFPAPPLLLQPSLLSHPAIPTLSSVEDTATTPQTTPPPPATPGKLNFPIEVKTKRRGRKTTPKTNHSKAKAKKKPTKKSKKSLKPTPKVKVHGLDPASALRHAAQKAGAPRLKTRPVYDTTGYWVPSRYPPPYTLYRKI